MRHSNSVLNLSRRANSKAIRETAPSRDVTLTRRAMQ